MTDGSEGVTADALDAMLSLDHPVKLAARDWAEENLPTAGGDHASPVITRDLWRRAGEFGVLGMQLPASHQGSPVDAVTIALTLEGFGSSSADNGVAFALASQAVTSSRALALSGSPEQLERWAPAMATGEIFAAFAMSETDAGSHPWDLATTAVAQADGSWVLDGAKAWTTLGPLCDLAVVFAATEPDKGQWGISAFLVDTSLPGVERGPSIDKMGLTACPFGALTFAGCHLDANALLGRPGAGAAIFAKVVEAERAFLYASQIGATERMIAGSVHYARTRQQGGVHIGSHQAVSHRIADIKLQHEAARLLLYKFAARFDRGDSIALEAALTKLMTAQTTIDASVAAMRTFGASGYAVDAGIEIQVRDALGGLSYSGTPDITRNIVASLLGLTRPPI